MSKYPVVEKFVSINGEGRKAGELAVFIRFRKCNLKCSYCDTLWAGTENCPADMISADELTRYVKDSGVKNVTLTGGEPLLQSDISELIEMLGKNGLSVEIETNGSIPLDNISKLEYRPSFTMDYKLPSSGMEKFMCTDNFNLLDKTDTVKFVVGEHGDLVRAEEVIKKYDLINKCSVYFSPVWGKIDAADIVEFMKEENLNSVRLQLQLHKFIWDPQKRGV